MSTMTLYVFAFAMFAAIFVQSSNGLKMRTMSEQCDSQVCRYSVNAVMRKPIGERCTTPLYCKRWYYGGFFWRGYPIGLPADGTRCGPSNVCVGGKCIETTEKVLKEGPDNIYRCETFVWPN